MYYAIHINIQLRPSLLLLFVFSSLFLLLMLFFIYLGFVFYPFSFLFVCVSIKCSSIKKAGLSLIVSSDSWLTQNYGLYHLRSYIDGVKSKDGVCIKSIQSNKLTSWPPASLIILISTKQGLLLLG